MACVLQREHVYAVLLKVYKQLNCQIFLLLYSPFVYFSVDVFIRVAQMKVRMSMAYQRLLTQRTAHVTIVRFVCNKCRLYPRHMVIGSAPTLKQGDRNSS